MSLAARIIPTLLCRGRQLVKGQRFDAWRSVGMAAQAVRIHQMRGVDELVLLDIAATKEGRGPDLALIEELAEVCFSPLTVGGGVRTLQDVRALLCHGADKVAIGTAGLEFDGKLICEVADAFGSSTVVVAMDVKDASVWTHGGKVRTHWPVLDWAAWVERLGAGEILLTDIEREGEMQGYNLPLISMVSQAVSIPVVAHGGCGTYEHMAQAIDAGASAVAAGAMFQFTDQTPKGAAEYLNERGYEVRL